MKNLQLRESPPVGATALRDRRLSPPSPSQDLGDRFVLAPPRFLPALLALRVSGFGASPLFGGGARDE